MLKQTIVESCNHIAIQSLEPVLPLKLLEPIPIRTSYFQLRTLLLLPHVPAFQK